MKIFLVFYLLAGVSFGMPREELMQYIKETMEADHKLIEESLERIQAVADSNIKTANLLKDSRKENIDILNSIIEKLDN